MNRDIQEKPPLQQMVQNSKTEMLEAALPFIAPSFQQPLALYIKAQELKQVHESFRHPDTIRACGLNNSNQGLEQMLRAMRSKADESTRSQIDQLLNMLQLSKMLPFLMQGNNNSDTSSSGGTSAAQEAMMSQLLDMMKQSNS